MLRSVLVSFSWFVAAVLAPAQSGGEKGPEAVHLEAIESSFKDLKSAKTEVRAAAAGVVVDAIDKVLVEYKNIPAERQKTVASTLGKIFAVRAEEDVNRVYIAAAAALSEMGPEGEAQLLKAFKVSHLEKRVEVQAFLIRALGKHRNEKQIDFFVKLLLKDEVELAKAATEALGEYREADGKVRKKITEALVREYAKTHNADNAAKGKDQVWHDRLLAIEVPMNTSLEMLTLQRFQSAPEWEKWFNDNRNKNW